MTNKQYAPPAQMRKDYLKSIELSKMTPEFFGHLQKIAKGLSPRIYNVKNREICVNYALGEICTKWNKFDITTGFSIFSYYTKIIKNDMIRHNKFLSKIEQRASSVVRY